MAIIARNGGAYRHRSAWRSVLLREAKRDFIASMIGPARWRDPSEGQRKWLTDVGDRLRGREAAR